MSYLKNRILSELNFIRTNISFFLHKTSQKYEVVVPKGEVRRILKRNNLYFDKNGMPTWWFSAFMNKRNSRDDLTKAVLEYIITNIPRDSNFLITGCGTGWMLFWLAQQGFEHLNGFDCLSDVVNAANELSISLKIKANIWQDDGFNPSSKLGKYDAILALHWLYAAWEWNYADRSYFNKDKYDLIKSYFGDRPYVREDRYDLLKRFISTYVPHLSKDGFFILELVDSIADFKVPPSDRYPIRHNGEQVAKCANELGLSVEKKMFSGLHGHQPRMVYILRSRDVPQSTTLSYCN